MGDVGGDHRRDILRLEHHPAALGWSEAAGCMGRYERYCTEKQKSRASYRCLTGTNGPLTDGPGEMSILMLLPNLILINNDFKQDSCVLYSRH